jgi:hypothetical protein
MIPFVTPVGEGTVRAPELAEYLAGGPANIAATLQRSQSDSWATIRFGYRGTSNGTIRLGDESNMGATVWQRARATLRRTAMSTLLGILTSVASAESCRSDGGDC